MAKEFLVEGAICTCKHGVSPGKLKVTDNKFFRMNGNKRAGTTMTLGDVFEPPGFGTCRINPMFPKPCKPAVTKWTGQFDGIRISAGGNPLTDESKATCATGTPDCIAFTTTGQIPVPGKSDFQEASAEFQNDLDPVGSPLALTEHQIDFNVKTKIIKVLRSPSYNMALYDIHIP